MFDNDVSCEKVFVRDSLTLCDGDGLRERVLDTEFVTLCEIENEVLTVVESELEMVSLTLTVGDIDSERLSVIGAVKVVFSETDSVMELVGVRL